MVGSRAQRTPALHGGQPQKDHALAGMGSIQQPAQRLVVRRMAARDALAQFLHCQSADVDRPPTAPADQLPPRTRIRNNDESVLKVSELKLRARSNTLLVRGGAPPNSRSSPSAGRPCGTQLSASFQKAAVPWPVHCTVVASASPQDIGPRASVALVASARAERAIRDVVFIEWRLQIERDLGNRRRSPWPSRATIRSAQPSLVLWRTPAAARSSRPTRRPARPVATLSTTA